MTHFRIIHLLTDPFLGDRIALGVVADGVGFLERPNVVAQLVDEAQRSHARAVLLALRGATVDQLPDVVGPQVMAAPVERVPVGVVDVEAWLRAVLFGDAKSTASAAE